MLPMNGIRKIKTVLLFCYLPLPRKYQKIGGESAHRILRSHFSQRKFIESCWFITAASVGTLCVANDVRRAVHWRRAREFEFIRKKSNQNLLLHVHKLLSKLDWYWWFNAPMVRSSVVLWFFHSQTDANNVPIRVSVSFYLQFCHVDTMFFQYLRRCECDYLIWTICMIPVIIICCSALTDSVLSNKTFESID